MERTCKDCSKFEVCKFKPMPYEEPCTSTADIILLSISYQSFSEKLFALYGTYCRHYKSFYE